MPMLNTAAEKRLTCLALAMVNQEKARVIVLPQQQASGFWFGGGNMIESHDGVLYLVGRYRNQGDSRLGVAAGRRGLELAIFELQRPGLSSRKVVSFSKSDLNVGDREVLSIEGSALHWTDDGVELFVSTERANIGYPAGLEQFLKPGTGVWTIEHIKADSIEGLRDAPIETILESRDPCHLHLKDPFLYETPDGDLVLLFCSHPFCWTSSNTGYAIRRRGDAAFGPVNYGVFPRGFTWDVAMTRGTAVVDVPQRGLFCAGRVSLLFYDGGESVRNLDEHASAVRRPRGYSCEEIGGVAYLLDGDLRRIDRLSKNHPLFVSPWGTGCSRYVDVLRSRDGVFVTWQQSQDDRSQPLVMNFVSNDEIDDLLSQPPR